MPAFTQIRSRIVALEARDVDTDQIIPARFLKTIDKQGLARALFADWRYLPGGEPAPSFPLNAPDAKGAEVLLAGDNFGCGSSREHAVWAIAAGGFCAVISTSFADIFRNNALKNGLLPIVVDRAAHERLFALRRKDPSLTVEIDLARQALRLPDGTQLAFPIDAFSKRCLLNGVDELGYLVSLEPQIASYESRNA